MAGVGQRTGENGSKFEFKPVDAKLIQPRPRKY
jgi:hypothetical protein